MFVLSIPQQEFSAGRDGIADTFKRCVIIASVAFPTIVARRNKCIVSKLPFIEYRVIHASPVCYVVISARRRTCHFRRSVYSQWKTSGVCANEETWPWGALSDVRETISQYFASRGRLSNRIVEYERAIHIVPSVVNGTRCSANSSTGDTVISPWVSTMSRSTGQVSCEIEVGENGADGEVAMASLVLLSRIISKGANGAKLDISFQARRSARSQCIACDGSCSLSISWPRRTASEEKSTFFESWALAEIDFE